MQRLVVVADNPLIVGAIRSGLQRSGTFQLLGYVDAAKATPKMVLNVQADVVLVDGDADDSEAATDFIRNLRDHDGAIHIIVLTLAMEGAWLRRAIDAGANSAMSKAIHPVALATLIRESANGHIVHAPTALQAATEPPAAGDGQHSSLTNRELEILRFVASGATNAEIARRLWITKQTVKFHVSNIYRKLGVANRTEACRYAHLHRLLPPPDSRSEQTGAALLAMVS